jgi:hypothetical protein
MEGVIGLVIVTAVLQSHVNSDLRQILSAEEVAALLDISSAISHFSPDVLATVQSVFAQRYNIQFRILAGLAATQIPSSLII